MRIYHISINVNVVKHASSIIHIKHDVNESNIDKNGLPTKCLSIISICIIDITLSLHHLKRKYVFGKKASATEHLIRDW